MKYDQLPVYKACYDLTIEAFNAARTMRREYRYSLAETLKKQIVEMMQCIYRASIAQDKLPHIATARELIEVVKLQVRLLHDLGQMPLKRLAAITLHMESVSRQLAAWQKQTTNQIEHKKKELVEAG